MVGPPLPPDLIAARADRKQQCQEKSSFDSSRHEQASGALANGTINEDARDDDDDEDDDDDDDVGPMLPGDTSREALYAVRSADVRSADPADVATTKARQHAQWMTEVPSKADWAQAVDTTKLKSRQFASSRPGRPTPHRQSSVDETWTSVGGAPSEPASSGAVEADRGLEADAVQQQKRRESEKLREQQDRGPSLYQDHTRKRKQMSKEDRDDPSSRPFDRSKDIGPTVSSKRARELAQRSKDMSSMFGESKYL